MHNALKENTNLKKGLAVFIFVDDIPVLWFLSLKLSLYFIPLKLSADRNSNTKQKHTTTLSETFRFVQV